MQEVHTWMEMGEQKKQGCGWLWCFAAATRNNTMPTLRTRNTLSQQDCLPKKVKSLTSGKANPMGEALHPMRTFPSCINLNQTPPGSLGKGQMGTQTQGKAGFEKAGSIKSPPQPLPAARAGPHSLPNVRGEALQGHIIQGQVPQAPQLGEALRKPVRT